MQTLVSLGDSLVDDVDVIDLLTVLADQAVDLASADAASILLVDDDGLLRPLAATSETARRLELCQLQDQEGPSLEAVVTGGAVVHGDLAAGSERWPRFVPEALAAGFRSVTALPLRLGQRSIGVFNLFRTTVGELDPADARLAQTLADVASIVLLQDQIIRDTQDSVGQLQRALDNRVIIEQAKGMIAERANVDMDGAFDRLRSYARSHRVLLTDVARQVTTAGPLLDELALPPCRNRPSRQDARGLQRAEILQPTQSNGRV